MGDHGSAMASQVVSSTVAELQVLEISSFIRGYHAYMDIWTPTQGQVLLVKREPTNSEDSNAVGVFQEDVIVGHVPYNLAPSLSQLGIGSTIDTMTALKVKSLQQTSLQDYMVS